MQQIVARARPRAPARDRARPRAPACARARLRTPARARKCPRAPAHDRARPQREHAAHARGARARRARAARARGTHAQQIQQKHSKTMKCDRGHIFHQFMGWSVFGFVFNDLFISLSPRFWAASSISSRGPGEKAKQIWVYGIGSMDFGLKNTV